MVKRLFAKGCGIVGEFGAIDDPGIAVFVHKPDASPRESGHGDDRHYPDTGGLPRFNAEAGKAKGCADAEFIHHCRAGEDLRASDAPLRDAPGGWSA